ncbi:TVP38/TMEM64 family protein [Sansalvadorimonas verongulae]|uniref:TVP38/TMEM64 family protein n=1 Tax=Sansalvadorimonas verongulae TaxID=2172824 RepID=UPI0018AD1F88|nr:VTT domain-containing protein [Sansalvadorimonas verongulae]
MNVIPPAVQALLKDNRNLALGLGFFSVAPLLFSSFLGSWLLFNINVVNQLVPEYGLLFVLASSLTMAAGLTPTTFVALVTGFFVGWTGTVVLVFAYTLASALGYGLGRILDGGDFLKSLMRFPVAANLSGDLRHKPIGMLILVRLSPALPFCLMNLLLAALKVKLRTFLLAGAVGMLPRTLFSLWVGNQSRDLVTLLKNGGGQMETTAVIVGSVFTVALLVWMVTKRVRLYLQQQTIK